MVKTCQLFSAGICSLWYCHWHTCVPYTEAEGFSWETYISLRPEYFNCTFKPWFDLKPEVWNTKWRWTLGFKT